MFTLYEDKRKKATYPQKTIERSYEDLLFGGRRESLKTWPFQHRNLDLGIDQSDQNDE